MSKRLTTILILALLVVLGVIGVFALKRFSVPAKTHYHAGFVVFENNKKIDFSGTKYMFTEPCVLNTKNEQDTPATIQIQKAHLHDNVGDVVHIERVGAIWKDLFTNIKFPIDYAKTTGFINGKKTSNFENLPIKNDDSLVVFIGSNNTTLQNLAPTKAYIEKMAKQSGTCGE